MNASPVAIVADSTISLPEDLLDHHHIYLVPHDLLIDGQTYRDGIDIKPADFYRLLRASRQLPKTSAPRPASFLEAFLKAGEHTRSILCLTLAARLSATYDSACAAAALAKEEVPNVEIRVMDTRTAGSALGLIALEAAQAAQRGSSLAQVAQLAGRVADRVYFVAFLETLYYLWKGGRIPKVAFWAGNLLNLKPMLELKDGEVHLLGRPRTRSRARQRLLAFLEHHAGTALLHATVMHANAPEEAESLKQEVQHRLNCREIFATEFTPVMGAHTGPGLLGLAFFTRE